LSGTSLAKGLRIGVAVGIVALAVSIFDGLHCVRLEASAPPYPKKGKENKHSKECPNEEHLCSCRKP